MSLFQQRWPEGEVCPKLGTWQSSPCFFQCCYISGTPPRPQHRCNPECLAISELSHKAACPVGEEPRSSDITSSPVALHRKPLADLTAEPGEIPFARNSSRAAFHPESLKSQTVLENHNISPSFFTTKLYSQARGLMPAGMQQRGAGLCPAAGGRTTHQPTVNRADLPMRVNRMTAPIL